MPDLKTAVRAAAAAAGFDLCGVAAAGAPPHGDFFRAWLARGNAAGMDYLERGAAKRLDPTLVLPGVRSILALGIRYTPPPPPPSDWRATLRGRIASYTAGRDYHDELRKRLKRLAAQLRELVPDVGHRIYVDSGPVLERDWAMQAGLGWYGRNTNLLHKQHGSWFFLAEVLTTLELEPDAPVADHCGTCTTCLVHCPTQALGPGYELDARRCISYWTIEHRGAIPAAMRAGLGNWIFGCDVCQEVCPWNAKMRPPSAPDERLTPFLPDLLGLDEDGFRERFRGSAVKRARRAGLARNVAVALGNSANPEAVPALARALATDPAPLVRGHAAWALGCIGGAVARAALERSRHDEDEFTAAEIAAALAAA